MSVIQITLSEPLVSAVKQLAARRRSTVAKVTIEALERLVEEADKQPLQAPVFHGGKRLPHQTEEWVAKTRHIA